MWKISKMKVADIHWFKPQTMNLSKYSLGQAHRNGDFVGSAVAGLGYPLSVSWAIDFWLEKAGTAGKVGKSPEVNGGFKNRKLWEIYA
jgi:hypothetical protein